MATTATRKSTKTTQVQQPEPQVTEQTVEIIDLNAKFQPGETRYTLLSALTYINAQIPTLRENNKRISVRMNAERMDVMNEDRLIKTTNFIWFQGEARKVANDYNVVVWGDAQTSIAITNGKMVERRYIEIGIYPRKEDSATQAKPSEEVQTPF